MDCLRSTEPVTEALLPLPSSRGTFYEIFQFSLNWDSSGLQVQPVCSVSPMTEPCWNTSSITTHRTAPQQTHISRLISFSRELNSRALTYTPTTYSRWTKNRKGCHRVIQWFTLLQKHYSSWQITTLCSSRFIYNHKYKSLDGDWDFCDSG